VVVKASLGAFLVGSLGGAVQAQQPWRGRCILANRGLMVGCGLVTTLVLIGIVPLTAARRRIMALIWR
jgi:hypothetical protein